MKQRHDFLGNTARCEVLILNEDGEPEACGWGEQASIHEPMQTIEISGREFTVTETGNPTMPYLLTGVRGAVYGAFAMRGESQTFAVLSYRGGALRINGNAVYLTDASSDLRAVQR